MKEEIFTIDQIYIDIDKETKIDCLKFLAQKAVEHHIGDDADVILHGLLEREAESSTGFVEGFAIPHTRNGGVNKTGIIVMKTTKGIEWESMDGNPAKFFIALFVPATDTEKTHITLLSLLARKMMSNEFKQKLLESNNTNEIFGIIKDAIQA